LTYIGKSGIQSNAIRKLSFLITIGVYTIYGLIRSSALIWPLVAAVLTALIWATWLYFMGTVPEISKIVFHGETVLSLPLAVSRLWDVLGVAGLVFLGVLWWYYDYRHVSDCDDRVMLPVAMVSYLIISCAFGIGQSITLIQTASIGLVFALAPIVRLISIEPGSFREEVKFFGKINASFGVGLGVGIGIHSGFIFGLVISVAMATMYTALFIFCFSLLFAAVHPLFTYSVLAPLKLRFRQPRSR
jgi:hypothetical protein